MVKPGGVEEGHSISGERVPGAISDERTIYEMPKKKKKIQYPVGVRHMWRYAVCKYRPPARRARIRGLLVKTPLQPLCSSTRPNTIVFDRKRVISK